MAGESFFIRRLKSLGNDVSLSESATVDKSEQFAMTSIAMEKSSAGNSSGVSSRYDSEEKAARERERGHYKYKNISCLEILMRLFLFSLVLSPSHADRQRVPHVPIGTISGSHLLFGGPFFLDSLRFIRPLGGSLLSCRRSARPVP